MKGRWWITGTVSIVLLVTMALTGSPAWAEDEQQEQEQKITMADLPPAVKAGVEQQTAGCTIKKIEKEVKDGQIVYEVEIMKDGKEIEIEFSEAGAVLKREAEEQEEPEEEKEND